MPQYKRQFWDLLSLLAELEKCGLSLCWVQQLGDVLERAAVIFAHVAVWACQTRTMVIRSDASNASRLAGVAVGGRAAVVSSRVKLLLWMVQARLAVMRAPVILEGILVGEGVLMRVHDAGREGL